jgi:hypothetical protein
VSDVREVQVDRAVHYAAEGEGRLRFVVLGGDALTQHNEHRIAGCELEQDEQDHAGQKGNRDHDDQPTQDVARRDPDPKRSQQASAGGRARLANVALRPDMAAWPRCLHYPAPAREGGAMGEIVIRLVPVSGGAG